MILFRLPYLFMYHLCMWHMCVHMCLCNLNFYITYIGSWNHLHNQDTGFFHHREAPHATLLKPQAPLPLPISKSLQNINLFFTSIVLLFQEYYVRAIT